MENGANVNDFAPFCIKTDLRVNLLKTYCLVSVILSLGNNCTAAPLGQV